MSQTHPQAVTPELRRWLQDQKAAGLAVLQAMVASGWSEIVALQALEEHYSIEMAALGLGASVPMPAPALDDGALYLDLGDRRVHVLQTLAHPRVVVFGDFLSEPECDALMAAARPRMSRSMTVQTTTGGEEINDDRTSQGMFFTRGESDLVRRVEARIARLLHWPVENGEGMQVLRYRPGAEYKAHYDYFDPREPGTPTILKRGGQRVATLVMYLSEPVRGGGTTFPDAGLEVAPKRGHAVFFSYRRPDPSTLTLHAGAPVLEGEKWIATKWLREHEFR
jgi:prolyl 4-hydroxylase